MQGVQGIFGPRFRDDGTQSPQATGNDKLFPDDCGRDTSTGTGKLCFPDGLLCQDREYLPFADLGPPSHPIHFR